ncbi:MAG: alanine--glyoxylate aminotransferase family protein [Armatimonadota bacterium]|nr:MAG: alanine--glyoxylate aminotransferase family protein [Armatimonadota bacterium]
MPEVYPELSPPQRILMGPGPSNVHPRVLRAMSTPLVGHLDPAFLKIADGTMALLRHVFQTQNHLTLPVSGTGSAGMEAAFCNVVEPGDKVLVCVAGLFGERMCDVAERCGAELARVEVEWGRIIEPEQVEAALKKRPAKVVAIVHAETSTGAWQPLEDIARIVHDQGALLLVDTVTSLGGVPVEVDTLGIDICYSGTQKCLSCPPGLAPITFNDRAVEVIHKRKAKVQSWYLDMSMVERYWGEERFYHHTAPITAIYGLYEGLRVIAEEGLDARWARHRRNGEALHIGLTAMELELAAQEGYRLPMLTSVVLPDGVDDAALRREILVKYGLELGGGLGKLKGKAWRVGLMGHSCSEDNVLYALSAIGRALREAGVAIPEGVGIQRACARLEAG